MKGGRDRLDGRGEGKECKENRDDLNSCDDVEDECKENRDDLKG